MQSRGVRRPSACLSVCPSVCLFPAYSWVLAKRLLSGWLVGKSCLSVSPRAAEGRQARVCVSTAVERRRREDRVTIPGFSTCHRRNGSGRVAVTARRA